MEIYSVVMVILGAIIGAGFSSGQEIYLFFYRYGLFGILGIFISTILIGLCLYKTIKIINYKNISNYKEFISFLIEDASVSKKNKNRIVNIIDELINILLLFTFFIMISGFRCIF